MEPRDEVARSDLLRSVVSSAREPMAVLSGEIGEGGPFVEFGNAAFARALGYDVDRVIGRAFTELWGGGAEPSVLEDVRARMARGERFSTDLIAARADGGGFLAHLALSPIRNPAGELTHYVVSQADTTRDLILEQILTRSDRDPVTRVTHRNVFTKLLRRAIERSRKKPDQRFAVLFLDLNGFKAINDLYGHLAGDQLLSSVATRLEETIRPGDVLARFGGDEFVILLELVGSVDDVLSVVDRIRERFAHPFQVEGRDVRIATSIGVALSETGYATVEEVLRDADSAMYLAKQESHVGDVESRYRIFDRALQQAASEARLVRSDLSGSLDRSEFRLHYQPLVNLASAEIVGVEVLLRWEHPQRGLIPATHFVSHAEELGLILPLGRWVAREALRQVRSWNERLRPGTPLILSLNVSHRELLDHRLAGWLQEALVEEQVEPSALLIEVPESFFDLRHAEVEGALRPISELGIRIGVDNFGTGRLALGDMHRFPLEFLKIDPGFVADLTRDEGGGPSRDGGAIRSILALARSMDLTVVAEGIETPDQESLLREIGCPIGQGFLYSEAVAPPEVEQWLQSGLRRRAERV